MPGRIFEVNFVAWGYFCGYLSCLGLFVVLGVIFEVIFQIAFTRPLGGESPGLRHAVRPTYKLRIIAAASMPHVRRD